MKLLRILVAGCVSAIAASCSNTTHQDGVDQPAARITPSNPDMPAFAPIGMVVDRKTKKTATGALVSNCHVLTNRHAVGGIKPSSPGEHEVEEDQSAVVIGNDVEFQIGYDSNEPSRLISHSNARVVDSGAGGNLGDWALLQLDDSLGKRYGSVRLARTNFAAGQAVITAGYPGEKLYSNDGTGHLIRDSRMWQEHGILLEDHGFWTADLIVLPGQSGAPVFTAEEDEYVVVGLLRAELPVESTRTPGKRVAQILPLRMALSEITAAIDRHPCD